MSNVTQDHDRGGYGARSVLVRAPVGLHDPAGSLDQLFHGFSAGSRGMKDQTGKPARFHLQADSRHARRCHSKHGHGDRRFLVNDRNLVLDHPGHGAGGVGEHSPRDDIDPAGKVVLDRILKLYRSLDSLEGKNPRDIRAGLVKEVAAARRVSDEQARKDLRKISEHPPLIHLREALR